MFGDSASWGLDSCVYQLRTDVVKPHFNLLMIFVVFIVQTETHAYLITDLVT